MTQCRWFSHFRLRGIHKACLAGWHKKWIWRHYADTRISGCVHLRLFRKHRGQRSKWNRLSHMWWSPCHLQTNLCSWRDRGDHWTSFSHLLHLCRSRKRGRCLCWVCWPHKQKSVLHYKIWFRYTAWSRWTWIDWWNCSKCCTWWSCLEGRWPSAVHLDEKLQTDTLPGKPVRFHVAS